MSCFSCFEWIRSSKPLTDDASTPSRFPVKVSSLDEALLLARAGESPRGWASPGPRSGLPSPANFSRDMVSPVANSRLATSDKNFELGDNPSMPEGFGLEQLLMSPGKLPLGLSMSERERLIRSTEPTSTFSLLGKVPHNILTKRGLEGQNLRRKMLSGATIVFFTAGYEGKRFVYERAAELGVKVVIIESPNSWSKQLVDEGIIAKFIPIDMTMSSLEVYEEALKQIRDLKHDPLVGEADGVATVVELSVPIVSRLAEQLGLPGQLPESVDQARDKKRTRDALQRAGLPTPRNYLITGPHDLDAAASHVQFPAVLKPISGAASLGVKKVTSADDFIGTYNEVSKELRSLVVSSGALVKDDGSGDGIKADGVLDTSLILEQYLDGDEVDVDIVMSGGEWRYAAVTDNGPTLEPYFNETWAVTPSMLPRSKQVELKKLAIDSVKALGFTDGVFHVECKATTTGPQLIEVNARMGGGPVHTTNLRVWGVDLVEETLFCSAGIPCRPDIASSPIVCIANSDVNTLQTGILMDNAYLEPLQDREGVISFSPHVTPGEEVVSKEDGMPTWLTEIVVAKPTPREAYDFLMEIESEVQAKVHVSPIFAIDKSSMIVEVVPVITED